MMKSLNYGDFCKEAKLEQDPESFRMWLLYAAAVLRKAPA